MWNSSLCWYRNIMTKDYKQEHNKEDQNCKLSQVNAAFTYIRTTICIYLA